MLASLPMYDFPHLRTETDQFWKLIRTYLLQTGIIAPKELTRNNDVMCQWSNPDLLLSQTCGYPYRKDLSSTVHLIGSADLGLECKQGYYYSCLIIKSGSKFDKNSWNLLAYNDLHSQSGWVAPKVFARTRDILINEFIPTGSHWNSAEKVANEDATIAAIDVCSWKIIQRYAPFAEKLQVVGKTESTPGLPYITAKKDLVKPVFEAINYAAKEMNQNSYLFLHFRPIVALDSKKYFEVEEVLDSITK